MSEVNIAVSILIAIVSFVAGYYAWKREFVGKRRIELVESVLALFYEAEDAIREIRSPFSFAGEGRSRERSDLENKDESSILDHEYVFVERYQKRQKLFAELRSLKYRMMATFGANAGRPFDDVDEVVRDIISSAYLLGSHYWPRQGRVQMDPDEGAEHVKGMRECHDVIWYLGQDDEVSKKMRSAVERVESFASLAAPVRVGFCEWIKSKFDVTKLG